MSRPAVAPARACAYAVLRRVFEQQAWADRALHAESRRRNLDSRDRAFAMRLSYGAVQRRATLDHVAAVLAGRPAERLDAPVLAALRLGLYQLLYLDRVPPHAAVAESVELAKADAPRGAGLVNAVLRRGAREGRALAAALPEDTPEQAALRHSVPVWVAQLWWEQFGASSALSLMVAANAPAEAALRANTLKTDAAALLALLPVRARRVPELPEGVVLEEPWDAFGSGLWEDGRFMPQSRAAMTVSRLLGPRPGERVLDLCAAPGAKTTHLAALIEDRGEVVAVERHAGRAQALRRTAARMGARCVSVRTADAAAMRDEAAYDRVLVDPPCSDLGTLASRPDARWRKDPAGVRRLAREQMAILRAGARALRPGGVLVYSTCTLSPRENEDLVRAFLAEHAGWTPDDLRDHVPVWQHPRVPRFLLTLPHRDDTEGFFIARLRRPGTGGS